MNRTSIQQNLVPKALLYSIVFDMRAIRYITAMLFIFFVVHPTTSAFAAEDSQEVEDVKEEVEIAQEEVIENLEQEDPEVTEDFIIAEELADFENSQENQVNDGTEDKDVEEDLIVSDSEEETETAVTQEDDEPEDILSDEENTGTASSTDGITQTEDEIDLQEDTDGTNSDSDTYDTSNQDISNETSTESTEDVVIAPTTASTTEGSVIDAFVVDSNAYTFDKSQCVEVSGGSFYCSIEENTSQEEQTDALYAAHDAQGDIEIYFVQDGKEYQVTDNVYDDVAPTYDPKSHTIVWHRLLNDRYQIVSYDIESGKENILTNNNTNDMEPARLGGVTVWQRWVGNNWEIILLQNGVETQLTANTVPDIGPKINGDYILWHTTNTSGEKKVALYNLNTQSITSINDSDGGAIENPRFILMYDKTSANGDVVTKGVDVLTGEVVPLAAAGGTLPDEIPNSDPTGETRALIQQKTNGLKEEQLDYDDTVQDPENEGTSTASTTQQNQAPTEIVVPMATSSGEVDEEIFVATSTSHIEDIVIPPSSTTTETHVE